MKTITRVMLVLMLTMGGSTVLETQNVQTVNQAHAAVGEGQIISYLTNRGYTVLSANKVQGNDDWICETRYGITEEPYMTTVHVLVNNIIGHEDVGM